MLNKNITDFLETFKLEKTPRNLCILHMDSFKTKIEYLLLDKLGRVHYDYIKSANDDSRDYSCSFNHIVCYGYTTSNALLGLCTKTHIKEEIYYDIKKLIQLLI